MSADTVSMGAAIPTVADHSSASRIDQADEARSPQITVVIPTHDRASELRRAIESVLSSPLIVSPQQIVVVDDDSRDETPEAARQLGVTYVRVFCRSAGGSRNAGFALVQTPYVTFLDDDDVWLPGNMEAQLAALEARPDAGFAYGIARAATEDLEPLAGHFPSAPLASGLVPEKLHMDYPQLGVVLFRRKAVAEAKGFDLRIRYYEDADLMLRIAARREILGVERVGMLYRERSPSKARADYFWGEARREVMRWRPKHAGVGWRTATKCRYMTKGRFCWRFFDDAAACAAVGRRSDALICLSRAVFVSPAHAVRYHRTVASILWRSINRSTHGAELGATALIGSQPLE